MLLAGTVRVAAIVANRFQPTMKGVPMSHSSPTWPSNAPTPAPERIRVEQVTYLGITASSDPSRLGDDLFRVKFSVRGTSFVVNDIAVPELLNSAVLMGPHRIVPFVAASINEIRTFFGAATREELPRAYAQRIAGVLDAAASLPRALRTAVTAALSDGHLADLTAAVTAGEALFAEFPELNGLDRSGATVAAFGSEVLAAIQLLESVSFDMNVLKGSDGYGESSVTEFVGRREARASRPFRRTGGIHTPGPYAAARGILEDGLLAAQLFTVDEVVTLSVLAQVLPN